MILVNYDPSTLAVLGFYLESQISSLEGKNYVTITEQKQDELMQLQQQGSLYLASAPVEGVETQFITKSEPLSSGFVPSDIQLRQQIYDITTLLVQKGAL